jgi:hypothetical protein
MFIDFHEAWIVRIDTGRRQLQGSVSQTVKFKILDSYPLNRLFETRANYSPLCTRTFQESS